MTVPTTGSTTGPRRAGPLRVGLIGAGSSRTWAARAHLPALRAVPDLRIVAVATTRRESAVAAATLTGAVTVALGSINSGAFSNNETFLAKLLAAAREEGEKMWPLPMDEEYKEQLKSAYADLHNIGGRLGGAITAALFLRDFVGDTPWIHLDIAGTAWLDDAKPYLGKGASGVGVRTFVRLAQSW